MLIKKLLIANRGEIACRIIKTCEKMGIQTVAVYSEADADALHVKLADQAILIGPPESSQSYLAIEKIIRAAKKSGAQAVHPGYGFLAENSDFVEALSKAKIKFIGPNAKAMKLLGDKIAAKTLAAKNKIPLLPSKLIKSKSDLASLKKIGLPLILKAAAGGGGRGMRKVYRASELADQVQSAAREAQSFFGDGRIYAEKLVEQARHIEVQVFADSHGKVIHLFDRDCSLQRQHQKVIEEAPAPNLKARTREALYKAALRIVAAAKYEGAATVEFLLDGKQNFYFMEVNTRLQVEHPVTEQISGLDLVELQIRIAQGEKLKDLAPNLEANVTARHSIECRICAEVPENNFIASTGKLEVFNADFPEALAVKTRLDTGFKQGDELTHYYDSLIAKLIVTGNSRDEAICLASNALSHLALCGLRTNLGYLQKLLNDRQFVDATHHINYAETLLPNKQEGSEQGLLTAALFLLYQIYKRQSENADPWNTLSGFRLDDTPVLKSTFSIAGQEVSVQLSQFQQNCWLVESPGRLATKSKINLEHMHFEPESGTLQFNFNDSTQRCKVYSTAAEQFWLSASFGTWPIAPYRSTLKKAKDLQGQHDISSPLPGKILSVKVQDGSKVKAGDVLLIIESMKMEHPLKAPHAGIVQNLLVKSGETIEANRILARMDYK